jgi:RNA polymerase sigma factor (sigma-70 family)
VAFEPALSLDPSGAPGPTSRPDRWTATAAFQQARLRAAAAGDSRAWDSIVGDYEQMVEGVARGSGLRAADVGDAVQTTWLRLLENIDRIEHPERLGGWLATTTRRECLRLAIRNQRAVPVALGDGVLADRLSEDPELVEQLVALERQAAVRAAIATLPPSSQALLELLMADPPLSYAEINSRLDVPIGSIGPTRGRLLKKLAQQLENQGIQDGFRRVLETVGSNRTCVDENGSYPVGKIR